jgi:predicted lipoprotein
MNLPRTRGFGLGSALTACALLVTLGCGSESTKNHDASDAPQRRELLTNLTERVIVPTFEDFVTKAKLLETSTQAYAKSMAEADLEAARTAWKSAMNVWERAETMQVGPTALATPANPGGMGLRNEIYAYPDTFPCGLDRVLVSKQYVDVATLRKSTYFNARGLSALEALLFEDRQTTACKADDTIVTEAAWNALVLGDLAARRAAYASTLATDVRINAEKVVSAWKSSFAAELEKAGAGSKLFATTGAAINALSDGLFYVDTETKDMKLGDPGGFTMTCMAKPCPEKVEHPFARTSKTSVSANLEGFRDLFRGKVPATGANGKMWGLRDLLISRSRKDIADDMDKLLDEAIRQSNMIGVSLEDALLEKNPQVHVAYAAIQQLTLRLKSDYIAALDLRAPMHAAGDND